LSSAAKKPRGATIRVTLIPGTTSTPCERVDTVRADADANGAATAVRHTAARMKYTQQRDERR